jgi:DNA-binding transcriptional ArsR family regulator
MATTSSIAKTTKTAKSTKSVSKAGQRSKQAHRVATLLKQVSDANRIQMILLLDDGEMHVGALCSALNQSAPAISHHLAILRHSGIVEPRRAGKNRFYSLTELGEDLAKTVRGVVG